ncbi:hypothetical protein DVV81_15475 [Clostridium botulinum]|uniref:hypothetical protein n=1 Tax=Clostridium botulinum TaxID=1491 RepID=UPI00196773AD|nr:hypothetical protein [Clostridium botulinum]MBN1072561.1 hypothetical protein [Clostridium botulinum]
MAKILLIDYIGHSDDDGMPLGHTIKTIAQYGEILNVDNSVDIAINKEHENFIESKYFKNKILFDKYVGNKNRDAFTRFKNKQNKLKKLKRIIDEKKYDLLIFINIDFELGMFIKKFKYQSKIAVISYMKGYYFGNILSRLIKNILLMRVFKWSDLIISSSRKNCKNYKSIYIPDYFYYPQLYDKYNNINKKEEYLCIGTISCEKDIELITNIFKNKSKKLNIIGKFLSEEIYKKLNDIKTDNIVIENRLVDYEEYYKLIAEHKYIILPYKEEFYKGRSSGVLLESIFLGSIPIAPKFLLEHNGVEGLGYRNKSELEIIVNDKFNINKINNKISNYYYQDNMNKIKKEINNVVS